MTCIIGIINENGGVLVSDTWNHTSKENHYIEKIVTGKGIAIGQAGENTIHFMDDRSIYILDSLQKVCDSFDSDNYEATLYNLYMFTRSYMNQLSISDKALEEYLVLHWDGTRVSMNPYRYSKEYVKTMRGHLEYMEEDRDLTDKMLNSQYYTLGKYAVKYLMKNHKTNFDGCSLEECKNYAIQEVKEQMEVEKSLKDSSKNVGGSIVWVTLDLNGNVTRGVEEYDNN